MTVQQPSAYDATYQHAGDQCSSTNEGRYVNIIEEVLTHPYHDDGLIRKGDPCNAFELVGIAMNSALTSAETVVLDTEGVWWLNVACELGLWGHILVGQRLYIDDGLVSDDYTNLPFGWALATVAHEATTLIAVKVHGTGIPWVVYMP